MRWDAGDLGCGAILPALRARLAEVGPGATLTVIVRDAGAPTDLPAWCRMTGHELVSAAPPEFVIRRRAVPGPASGGSPPA